MTSRVFSRRRAAAVAAVVAAAFVVTGCAPPASEPAADIEGGTVTVRLSGDWGNPIDGGATISGGTGLMINSAMYSTLAYFDSATGEILPYIAESWETEPSSITFTLRDDVTCSDGTPLTPTAVYDSFARYIAPETESPWLSALFGPGPYTIDVDEEAGTFTFGLPRPNVRLLAGLADVRSGIVCPAGLEPDADFTTASYGTGPFVFESARQGDEFVVTKREDWTWGPNDWTSDDSGFPDEIVFRVLSTDTTAANALVTEEIDISPIAGVDAARLGADPAIEEQLAAAGAPYLLVINQTAGRPGTSEAVRQAVITALNPADWTTAAGEPDAPISTNIQANPGGYCYTDLSSILAEPSIEGAREILLDDGYTEGADGKLQKDGQPLTLSIAASQATGSGGEYLRAALEDVGINAVLNLTDHSTFAEVYGRMDYDVIIGLHGGERGVPSRTPLFMTGPTVFEGGSNRMGLNDPELTALANQGYGASTLEESCEAWEEFNRYAIENWIGRAWASQVTHWFSREGEFSYIALSAATAIPMSIRRLP